MTPKFRIRKKGNVFFVEYLSVNFFGIKNWKSFLYYDLLGETRPYPFGTYKQAKGDLMREIELTLATHDEDFETELKTELNKL